MRILPFATALLWPSLLVAQAQPADLARERAQHTQWLATSATSPARAIAFTSVGDDPVTLGPSGSAIPVAGAPRGSVTLTRGQLVLEGWGATRTLGTNRPLPINGVQLLAISAGGRPWLQVYRDDRPGKRPTYFPYTPAARRSVEIDPLDPRPVRLLAPEGVTVEAMEMGTVEVTIEDTTVRLTVMRFPVDAEESRILINFRDGTNDAGTYPAGRWVELIPEAGGRFTLDFNRAFNPLCAYSSVFPCPIPWRGNAFTARIEAGEKYPAEAVTP